MKKLFYITHDRHLPKDPVKEKKRRLSVLQKNKRLVIVDSNRTDGNTAIHPVSSDVRNCWTIQEIKKDSITLAKTRNGKEIQDIQTLHLLLTDIIIITDT